MRIKTITRIIIAAAFIFVLVLTVCAVVINIFLHDLRERDAVQITRLYAERALGQYRDNGFDDKHINPLLLSGNGTIINQDISIVSFLLDSISIQTAEKISEFIREPYKAGFVFSNEKSYMCILPFTENGEQFFVYVDVPVEIMKASHKGLFSLLFVICLAGLILLGVAIYFIFKKSIAGEASAAGEPEQLKREYEQRFRISGERFEEENAKAATDMQAAFFGRISHEIRTPMNSILGIAQIMLADSKLSGTQTKYMNDIKLSANTLLRTINDSLDFSRLSTGKIPLEQRDYNFIQLVDNVSAYARLISEQKGLRYNFSIPEKLPQCLYGDDVRLKQCLINIIGNAVKFTKTGSVSFNVIARKDNLLFEVKDTGPGIENDNRKNLFNPFSSTVKAGMGIGLGLPITKSLVKLMGGDLSFYSECGTGSTFMITIPKIMGDSNNLKPNIMKSDLSFSSSTRILIVDDNEINLNVAEGLISSLYGIECDTALSGAEALVFVKKYEYSLIFMDHMMPEMDGIEATARIREINSAVPIIALTANAMIGSKEMLVKAGMNDLLAKPIVIDEMYSVLRKWLPAKKIISKQNPTSENPIIIDDLLSFMEKGGRIITAAMNIPELDVNAGLSAAAFREDVYESSLKLLFSKIPKITDTLKICLDENNIPEFILHVQEMKSSLSAVGASSLSNQAAALEGAGSEGDSESCKKMFPEFAASLKMLKEQIALFFTGDAPVPKKTGTQAILNKNIAVLTEALENYNYDLLIETITSMAEFNFGFEINSDILKIKILADNFDYDGIIEALGEIRDLR